MMYHGKDIRKGYKAGISCFSGENPQSQAISWATKGTELCDELHKQDIGDISALLADLSEASVDLATAFNPISLTDSPSKSNASFAFYEL